MVSTVSQPGLSTAWHVSTQRRQSLLLAAGVVIASLLAAGLALLLQIVSAVVVATWLALFAIAWRPLVGLYVALGLVLLFEAGSADQLMLPGAYFHGGLSGTLGLPVIASPLELLLVLTFLLWLARGIAGQRLDFRTGHLFLPMMLFLGALVMGLVRGVVGGGDLNVALWESRFLFYMVICYVLAANTIRTRRQLAALIGISLITMALFAVEGAYRRLALIDTGILAVAPEFAYGHESTIFLGALLLLVLAQQVFGAPWWQRLVGLIVLPVAVYTLLATERRAAYIAVAIAFVAVALILMVVHRKAFVFIALPIIVAAAVYLPLFWNNTTLVGQPARAVRSLYQPDPRDALSNQYRDLEKINVRATIHAEPLFGVGFGRPFLMVAPLPDISWWPFWRYEPHHNIMWVWLKTGAIGFIFFWLLIGATLARSAHFVKRIRDRDARVFAVLAVSGIVGFMVFCYVDLGLVSGRVTVFLGTLMGTVAVLDQLQQ